MRFGELALTAGAVGAVLAHAQRAGPRLFKKGHRLRPEDVATLRAEGLETVVAVTLDPGDLGENAAAEAVAQAVAGPGVGVAPAHLGRANLLAREAGLLEVSSPAIDALNAGDEAVTLATLPPGTAVEAGDLVATVKVIPFALPAARVAALTAQAPEAVTVHRWCGLRAGLVLTSHPRGTAASLDRAAAVQQERLARLAATLGGERRVAHDRAAVAGALVELAAAGCSPLLVLGASATADRADVIPAAIEAAGGTVERLGVPVDPGNLVLLARLGATPVLGVPACARSPKRSGFDRVLERLAAGLPVSVLDVARWGVGGLLAETPRPAPRRPRAQAKPPRVAALVLAAGGSTRMGGVNKLVAPLDGQALVAHGVDAALASRARPVVVVTGHDAAAVHAALGDRAVTFQHNPGWAEGLASSLRAGIAALPAELDGVLICLGDMPRLRAEHLNRLIAAFDPRGSASILVPSHLGQRGHPVLFARRWFPALTTLHGDVGARSILAEHPTAVATVEFADDAVTRDVDTPAALLALTLP